MNCKQCLEAIVKELQGELEHPLSEALHIHIGKCRECRREYEELRWLQTGMKKIGEVVESAHISSRLLYDYVVFQENLNDHTIWSIEDHLGRCADCQEDVKIIRDLNSIKLADDQQEFPMMESGKGFWARISSRRHLLAYSSAVIAIAAIFASILYFEKPSSNSKLIYFAKQTSLASPDYSVKELKPVPITRGLSEEELHPSLISISNPKKLILKINLDMAEENMGYRVKVYSAKGETLWESNINREPLNSGILLLYMDKDKFAPGLYYVDIIEHSPNGYESSLLRTSFRLIQ